MNHPIPTDPIGAARDSLRLADGMTSDRLRQLARDEDARDEADSCGVDAQAYSRALSS